VWQFFNKLRERERDAQLIVTGDLTSTGHVSQYDRASRFLSKRVAVAEREYFGLGTPDWRDWSVPGNHDYWPGKYFYFGAARRHMRIWAREFPAVGPSIPLMGGEVRLRFMRLDTDSGVRTWGPSRFLARGNCTKQLRKLEERLSKIGLPSPDEIRVLLLHHSLAYRDPSTDLLPCRVGRLAERFLERCLGHSSLLGRLEMNMGSRDMLRRLLAQFNIRVILTGHTHTPYIASRPAACRTPPRLIHVLEACCGTTTMVDQVPAGWPAHRDTRKLHPNTLIIHRLEVDGARIVWHAETWWRDAEQGFVNEPPSGCQNWSASLCVR
jgi:hypothetical protein